MPTFCKLAALAFVVIWTDCAQADQFHLAYENVLGTTLELQIEASSEQVASTAETCVLNEIQRQSAIFSTYDAQSELSQFLAMPAGASMSVSDELLAAFQLCEQWQRISRGAFNPAVEELLTAQRLPVSHLTGRIITRVNQPQWQFNAASQTMTRLSDCEMSLNAIAKGIIIDRAVDAAIKIQGVSGVLVNIGGDLRVAGDLRQGVAIADPDFDTLSGAPIQSMTIESAAIATSGFSERPQHIIDPRSGKPAAGAISASVMASTAATADVLATIACVLSPNETLALVDSMAGTECLLVTSSGAVLKSESWPREDTRAQDATKTEPTGHDFLLEFEIGRPENARRYRRPYVAVWVEDEDRFPVKTLSLFVMQNNPGPRWYRDIRRWYSDDQMRQLVDQKDLLKTVSKPTRNPGKYKVQWDGRDDGGELLKAGKYTLLIESAREHGSYQLIRQEFEFGKAIKKKLKGNAEIPAASIEYKVGKS